MPAYSGNAPYFALDGVSLATPFISVEMDQKNNTQEVTAGTGATDTQRAPGLNDTTFKVEIGYLTSGQSGWLQKLKAGAVVSLEWGPEGNVTGKPRHVQSCICESNNHGVKVTKEKVSFQLSFTSADAPSVNMFGGGVYP